MNRLRQRHRLEAHAVAQFETVDAACQAAQAAAVAAELRRTHVLAGLVAIVGSPVAVGELTGQPTAAVAHAVKACDDAVVDDVLNGWRRQTAVGPCGSMTDAG